MDRKSLLLQGDLQVGVWGVGHIGYSTMCHFAEGGARCLGYDIDSTKVEKVNRGESAAFAMDYWLGFSPSYLFQNGAARATSDWQEMVGDNVGIHFVCVPTERHGQPWLEPLLDVCRKLTWYKKNPSSIPPLVIIESTMTPTTMDKQVSGRRFPPRKESRRA